MSSNGRFWACPGPLNRFEILSRSPLQAQQLSPDETHVWFARLSAAVLAELPNVLDGAENERASRFVFAVHAARFRCARTILRLLLGSYLNQDPSSVQFRYGPHGKPEVEGLGFNISHSGDAALFAFTRLLGIGADIEVSKPQHSALVIARHFFSPVEQAALAKEPDPSAAFLRCWTRKEAFIKALGAGLTLDLASFDVSLDATAARLLAVRDPRWQAADWRLYDVSTPDEVAALALYRPQPEHQLRRFSFSPS